MLCVQHIDKMFKHKELQQQLMDTKLQRITEMMKEVEEKQQKERDLVSGSSRPSEAGGPTVPGQPGCSLLMMFTINTPTHPNTICRCDGMFAAADRCHRVQAQV